MIVNDTWFSSVWGYDDKTGSDWYTVTELRLWT